MATNDPAISVRGLGKAYTIAHQREVHSTLAETVLQRLRRPFQRTSAETFWALKDLSFDVRPGEVVGVIGRNGAGKSTLLKILSRITEPTTGEAALYGRVGSLLEVGTGFHGELTGRENIYLSGQILGMRKKEVDRQFDAIVDFSGCARFLDTPVKRYSSGMYVRLAFAVAAHLESEILVVDEVLAVGDAEFQKKCLGKMKDVATGGRTVLFVSHHMQSVQVLCNRGIYLEKGACLFMGDVEGAMQRYINSFEDGMAHGREDDPDRRPGTGDYRITHVAMSKRVYACAEPKEIEMEVSCRRPHAAATGAYLNVLILDAMGTKVATCDMRTGGRTLPASGDWRTTLTFRSPWLKSGEYRVLARVCNFGIVDVIEDACRFTVSDILPYGVALNDPLAVDGLVLGEYEFQESAPSEGPCRQ